MPSWSHDFEADEAILGFREYLSSFYKNGIWDGEEYK